MSVRYYFTIVKKVFVSGCYDILHAGHVQFFEDARALGGHLTVCFASDQVLLLLKKRRSSMPEDNKRALLSSLRSVDDVVSSSDLDPVFDFKTHIDRIRPDIIAITEDDKNAERKRAFCAERGIELVVLPKRNNTTRVSTTAILSSIKNIDRVPLRVDFAGGWLDVPRFSRPGTYIVNCAISPLVSLADWPYEQGAGLGGSAAYAMLQAKSGIRSELDMAVGWQDPAVILETGLCVWESGMMPRLNFKIDPGFLDGRMALLWTGKGHVTPDHVEGKRDYDKIARAGAMAREAVRPDHLSYEGLCAATNVSYEVQCEEGMEPLPHHGEMAKKYCGGGFGGYALYLFRDAHEREQFLREPHTLSIEPYVKLLE